MTSSFDSDPDHVDFVPGWPRTDQEAFARLFEEYFGPVYRYVYSYVPNAEDAKDIVHTVFSRIWTGQIVPDSGRPVMPLLCTVSRFVAIDYLRHGRVEADFARRCLEALELDQPLAAAEDPAEDVLRQERVDLVRHALRVLSPRQHEVLLLRWRDQLTYGEIAEQLGISKKTVAEHLSRAMENLRRVLPAEYEMD